MEYNSESSNTYTAGVSATIASRQPQVVESMSRLGLVISKILELEESLRNKLAPVIDQNKPLPPDEGKADVNEIRCKLASDIDEWTHKLCVVREYLDWTICNLEL